MLPDSQADLTVVIPTVGRADALKVCFESLCAQTVRPAEVMVVHSGTDPETRALCEENWAARGLRVEYVSYPHRSAALQRDSGVRRSTRELVMFADDDMEFEPRWIEELLRVMAGDAAIGAAMGCIVNQPMPTTWWWRLYRRLAAPADRAVRPGAVVGALVPNGFPAGASAPIASEWIGGCITLLRRRAYLSVNGFAPHFRGSSPGEDIDLGYRLSRTWKIAYVPSARCLHHQSPLGREGVAHRSFLSVRSRYAFCRASVEMGQFRTWAHILLWAAFQTFSDFAQVIKGRGWSGFVEAGRGRARGAWSCVGWDPAAERFPDWHDTDANA